MTANAFIVNEGGSEIGHRLSRKHWGKGYMTEACKAFSDYLFDIGFHAIVIEANVDNFASNRVIAKCGSVLKRQEKKEHCSALKRESIIVNWYEMRR